MDQYPFQVDPRTNEPFLRLPEPFQHIILTPPRLSDADAIVTILNDPRVYPTLEGPPFPYHYSDALDWLKHAKNICDDVWTQILLNAQDGQTSHHDRAFGDSPVRIIREVDADGIQTYLGDCGISRWGYPDIKVAEERESLTAANDARSIGDENIIWMFGDYISATHHGRGIMTAVMRCLMKEWVIPFMKPKHIKATVHHGNIASVRVFEKNGFFIEATLENFREKPKSKGGATIGLDILHWSA